MTRSTASVILGLCGMVLLAGIVACKGSKNDDGAKAEPAPKLAPGERASSNPFSKSAEAVVEGRKIYLKNGCAGCHGMGGGGGMGKPLIDDEWRFGSDDPTLFKLIRGEIPQQTMPNAIGKTLTDDEIWKVLLYVRSVYAGEPTKIN